MRLSFRLLFTILFVLVSIGFVAIATTFNSQARMMPLIIGTPVMLLAITQLVLELRRPAGKMQPSAEYEIQPGPPTEPSQAQAAPGYANSLKVFAWVVALFIAIYLVGYLVTVFFYPLLYMRLVGHRRWRLSAGISLGALAFVYIVMVSMLQVELYGGVITLALRKAIMGY